MTVAAIPRFIELVRVSSTKQSDSGTPEVQKRELDRLRESRPGIFVERISDGEAGLSGALGFSERPDLQRLAKLAKAKAFDELRIWDLDRLTRSPDLRERAAIFGIILDAGAKIVDRHGRETDPSDVSGMGEVDYYLRTYFASQERRKILERTMGGRKKNAAHGCKPQGRSPFAFTYDAEAKVWAVDEEKAGVVRFIFASAVEGTSVSQIGKKLEQRGTLSPSGAMKWNVSYIHNILRSTLYTGTHTYKLGSETFTVKMPRIVDEDLWERAQTALTRRNFVPVRTEYTHEALLRMRAVCGTCGSNIYVDASKTYGAHRFRYQCGGRKHGRKCGARNHPIQSVDAALWEAVATALKDPHWLEKAIRKQQGSSGKGEWQQQIDGCETKLIDMKKKEASVLKMLGQGLAEEACKDQLQAISKSKQTVQRSLEVARRALAQVAASRASSAALEAKVAYLRTLLDSGDYKIRESVIRALTPEDGPLVTLHHDGRIELHGVLAAHPTTDESLTGKKVDDAPHPPMEQPRKAPAAIRLSRELPLRFTLTTRYSLHSRCQEV